MTPPTIEEIINLLNHYAATGLQAAKMPDRSAEDRDTFVRRSAMFACAAIMLKNHDAALDELAALRERVGKLEASLRQCAWMANGEVSREQLTNIANYASAALAQTGGGDTP